MKSIIHISLGAARDDYEFKTSFIEQPCHVQHWKGKS